METDETVNNIIIECCQLAQKASNCRYDFVWKNFLWGLCKWEKNDHAIDKYMHIPESVIENGILKNDLALWDTNYHTILARRLEQVLINQEKKGKNISRGFFSPSGTHTENEWREKYWILRETGKRNEKAVEFNANTNCIRGVWYDS